GDLDQHLAVLGLVELDVLDAPRRVDLPEDRSLGLHVYPPGWLRRPATECIERHPCPRDRRSAHRSVRCAWPAPQALGCTQTLGWSSTGPSTGSIALDQSTSSVEPPDARTAARSAASCSANATTSSV